MAWTDPKTMAHEPTIYTDWNTYVRDNTNYLNSRIAVQAWVNFNGTGTVAIRASYNVSSITDDGIGKYTVNFTSAMTDANYAVLTTVSLGLADFNAKAATAPYTTNSVNAVGLTCSRTSDSDPQDMEFVSVAVLR